MIDDGPRTWVSVHRAIGGLAQAGLPGDFAQTLRRDLDEHFVTEVEDPVARWGARLTAPQQDADPREH